MIKGKQKQDYLSVEQILGKTNGGYDIFRWYLGEVSRSMNRPWGKKEKKPSWGIYPKQDGVWVWKDLASEETGNAFTFVEKMFGLKNFAESRDKILWDFGFGGSVVNVSPAKVTWEKPEIKEEYSDIRFESQPFKKEHNDFWNITEVTESQCNRFNCWAVKSAAMDRRIIPIRRGEPVFAFYCPELDSTKLYFPHRDAGKKFRTNVPYHHLWNFDNVTQCENLPILKSNKDMIVVSMITECVIATMCEATRIFMDREGNPTDVVHKINSIAKTPWVWYGSDWDGVKKCKEITDTYKWRYINTDRKYLPSVNDPYSIVKMWNTQNPGTGLKNLSDFMKQKGLL